MIAAWMQALGDTYSMHMLREIRRLVFESGYELLVRDMGAGVVSHTQDFGVKQWPVDGIIVMDGTEEVRCLLRSGRRPSAPVVSIGGDYDDEVDYAGVDLRNGAQRATEHLISVGCRRVAFLTARSISAPSQPRRQGYLTAIIGAGLTPEFIITDSDFATRQPAFLTAMAYIQSNGAPDGIFCANDDMAIGAFKALQELGLRVPQDVALIGCDGTEETEYYQTPISTLVQPIHDMCATAWKFLMRRIQNPSIPPQNVLLTPELVIRESSRKETSPRD